MNDKNVYRKIEREISAMQARARQAMVDEYPIGLTIYYRHGNQVRQATVIDHSSFPWERRLRVEGVTGARYWLDAMQVDKDVSPLLYGGEE